MAEYKMVRLGDVCEIQSGGTHREVRQNINQEKY